MGRPPKRHVRREIRLDAGIADAAEAVRGEGETFTTQVEDGLRRHIAARRRVLKKPVSEGDE